MPDNREMLFLIGAAKAGTTSLFHYLSQHPEIAPCAIKEPHYYSLGQFADGTHLSKCMTWKRQSPVTSERQYWDLYKGANHHQILFEASTSYLYHPQVPDILHERHPSAKILVVLRNPIDRAFSDYKHQRRLGKELLSFEKAIARELAGGSGYLSQGYYMEQIARYSHAFDKHAILITFFDALHQDQEALLRQLCTWLEIDDSFTFRTSTSYNVGKDRIPTIYTWYRGAQLAGRLVPGRYKTYISHHVESLLSQEAVLSDNIHAFLAMHYQDTIHRLQDCLQMDLSHWLHR